MQIAIIWTTVLFSFLNYSNQSLANEKSKQQIRLIENKSDKLTKISKISSFDNKDMSAFAMKILPESITETHVHNIPPQIDILSFARSAEKIFDIQKHEFETTADFENRKTISIQQKIYPDFNISDSIGFVIPVEKLLSYDEGIRYSYDADSKTVRIFILPSANHSTNIDQGLGMHRSNEGWKFLESLDKFRLIIT